MEIPIEEQISKIKREISAGRTETAYALLSRVLESSPRLSPHEMLIFQDELSESFQNAGAIKVSNRLDDGILDDLEQYTTYDNDEESFVDDLRSNVQSRQAIRAKPNIQSHQDSSVMPQIENDTPVAAQSKQMSRNQRCQTGKLIATQRNGTPSNQRIIPTTFSDAPHSSSSRPQRLFPPSHSKPKPSTLSAEVFAGNNQIINNSQLPGDSVIFGTSIRNITRENVTPRTDFLEHDSLTSLVISLTLCYVLIIILTIFRSGRADAWFSELFNKTHPFIVGPGEKFQNAKVNGRRYEKVRIAVLDTGFACRTEEDRMMTESFKDKVVKMESFLDNEQETDGNRDESGHGTAVVYQLARVCPNAELYVARVAKKQSPGWTADHGAVKRAIEKACNVWQVHIINMSFGWNSQESRCTGVKTVDDLLEMAKSKGVLLFASTSNFGILNYNEYFYPARSNYVIPVEAADGMGGDAPTKSTVISGRTLERFAAPGLEVKGPSSHKRVSGSSFACAIVAGVAALILEFARQPPLGEDRNLDRHLRYKEGMTRILHYMSDQHTPHGAHFLCPWKRLYNFPNSSKVDMRQHQANNIILKLTEEFKGG